MAIVNLNVPSHTGTELGPTVLADLKSDMQAIETSNNDIEARQLLIDPLASNTASIAAAQTATAADRVLAETAKTAAQAAQTATAAERVLAETAKTAAQTAESNAVAVVTGGTASLTPVAGQIPLARADGSIDPTWLGADFSVTTLPAIASSITANAVDVFIYDTAKDSDGGAWRKRCQHLIWYNEALNTATRGSRKEFPVVALIVAEAAKVIIYDMDDPTIPMWKVIQYTPGKLMGYFLVNLTSSVTAKNGSIFTTGTSTTPTNGGGLRVIDFIADTAELISGAYGANYGYLVHGITQASIDAVASPVARTSGLRLINAVCNDVAITVLPNAPIDSVTGLPVPTIAVATAGGVSVIKDDGSVVNSSSTATASFMTIDSMHRLVWTEISIYRANAGYIGGLAPAFLHSGQPLPYFVVAALAFNNLAGRLPLALSNGNLAAGNAVAGTAGLTVFRYGVDSAGTLHADITNTHNTGYMVGDIRRCYLANSLTADRSVKAGTLTMVGAVTETVNAGGRNVYSGFSVANYLQEASHADFNALGTGDFSIIMSGLKWGLGNTTRTIISIGDGTSAGSFDVQLIVGGRIVVRSSTGAGMVNIILTIGSFSDSAEHVFEVGRGIIQGVASSFYIRIDGLLIHSSVSTNSISNAGNLTIGAALAGINPWAGGQCACVRISATAPTAEQSKFIADQENKLNGGAQCLLSSSNSVSALAFDEDTDVLHAGNGVNVDQFVGLERIASAAHNTGTLKSISASNGAVTFAGTTSVETSAPAKDIRSELNGAAKKLADAKQKPVPFRFDGDGATTAFRLDTVKNAIGYKPQSVLLAGAEQDEGSADDYTVTFDGFVYSALFAVAPIAGTGNVKIKAVRY